MKPILKIISIWLFLCFLNSCMVSTHITSLQQQEEGTDIEVYLTKLPAKEYDEIVHIEGFGGIFASNKQLLRKIKVKAKEQGADAIINVRYYNTTWWPVVWPCIEGVAIKYKD